MRISNSRLVEATLAYADIFSYPLTGAELRHWFLFSTPPAVKPRLSGISTVTKQQDYFVLKGRTALVKKRIARQLRCRQKWDRARKIADILRILPSVQLVGITGGVAMNNADTDDDIDLFLITAKNTLWITRLLVTLIVSLLGVRRSPGEKTVENKLCLNMFMSEHHLSLPWAERDLYGAHEVLQMHPLWQRDNAYAKFLASNSWVRHYLPTAWRSVYLISGREQHTPNMFRVSVCSLLSLLEYPSRIFQLVYMQRRRTSERISKGVLRFHPHDARAWVKKRFFKRLKALHIPLDNAWWSR